ncbi:hypothetical protein ACLI4R_09640 [Natrialbaceae archaeon A-chndr2]|uniref:hypothetical protein n=1 Tax=Natronosalvus amylolyticus TaxID=2961994 RepID=UPI0020C9F598|nr:hypothetical protein [Natronosalvus amylolyticus]
MKRRAVLLASGLALQTVAAGCLEGDPDTEETDDGAKTDDGTDDAMSTTEGGTEYLDVVLYWVDPDDGDDTDCLSMDDERFDDVTLFREAFAYLEDNPPETWYDGAEPGAEAIAATTGPETDEGEQAATAYRSVFEDDTGVTDGVPEAYVRGARAASDATRSHTVPCLEHDGNVIALLLRVEQEN